jgi:hypothetical protein
MNNESPEPTAHRLSSRKKMKKTGGYLTSLPGPAGGDRLSAAEHRAAPRRALLLLLQDKRKEADGF